MKPPYINQYQRQSIAFNTTYGNFLLLNIALKKLCRELLQKPITKMLDELKKNRRTYS